MRALLTISLFLLSFFVQAQNGQTQATVQITVSVVNIDSLISARVKAAMDSLSKAYVPKRDTIVFSRKDTVVSVQKFPTDSLTAIVKRYLDTSSKGTLNLLWTTEYLTPLDATYRVYKLSGTPLLGTEDVRVARVPQRPNTSTVNWDYSISPAGGITFTSSRQGKEVSVYYAKIIQ